MIDIISEVNNIYGVDARIKSNERHNQKARQTVAYILKEKYNYPLKAIAAELGLSGPPAASRLYMAAKKNKSKLYID